MATAAPDSAISASALTKRFGTRPAVTALDFTIPRGVIAGFVGPNGSGKTTTMRMLLGLVRPTAGTATILDSSVDHPRSYLSKVGALIESPAFYPTLSGRANLATLATLGGHDRGRVDSLLETVGLADRGGDAVRTYSLGMKQRLGIAGALLSDPELLILDEPANGLDPPGIIEMRDLMRRLRDGGKTLMVSSHLLGEVEQVADWLVVVKDGRALYCGAAATLPGHDVADLLVETAEPAGLDVVATIAREHGHTAVREGSALRVTAPPDFAATLNREAMQAGAVIVELHRAHLSLEESFLRLISGDS